jgi:uncharacterized protein YbjT (DUF2867 family)
MAEHGTKRRPARLAIAGATGYVGRRLTARLLAAGHEVVALVRDPAKVSEAPGLAVRTVDLTDPDALSAALDGVEAAFYLVHSMAGGDDFDDRDRELAMTFAKSAAAAGVGRIVYLGGLGSGGLSEHLASRQEVGRLLGSAQVPVVELRAAVVLGAGSISFEMLRYLTERLPFMVCPRWVNTSLQPIAERDLLSYLEQSLDVEPSVYEIGSPEVTTYRSMIHTYAEVRGLRKRLIVQVPLLTPSLSSRWVDVATPVDRVISHQLIESLTSEVVVRRREHTDGAFDVQCLGVADAIRAALDDQAARVPDSLMGFHDGLLDGVYAMRASARLRPGDSVGARRDLGLCGGDLDWYGLPWAWHTRIALGRLFGERLALFRPRRVEPGATVDWWQVEEKSAGTLVLGTTRWFCGEAWLGYRVTEGPRPRLEQVGALRPLGLLGLAYWRAIWPVHLVVFRVMVRRQARRAHKLVHDPASM